MNTPKTGIGRTPSLKVLVCAEDGTALWCRGAGFGIAANSYLTDGTQQRIIDALLEALVEARRELGCSLEIFDAVPDGGTATTKIYGYIPVAGTRNGDPGGKPLEEATVIGVPTAPPEALEVGIVGQPNVALMVTRHDDNVTFVQPFARVDEIRHKIILRLGGAADPCRIK